MILIRGYIKKLPVLICVYLWLQSVFASAMVFANRNLFIRGYKNVVVKTPSHSYQLTSPTALLRRRTTSPMSILPSG